jgi:hypothetical protein
MALVRPPGLGPGPTPPTPQGGPYTNPTGFDPNGPALRAPSNFVMPTPPAGATAGAMAGPGYTIHGATHPALQLITGTGTGPTVSGLNPDGTSNAGGLPPTPPVWWPPGTPWPPGSNAGGNIPVDPIPNHPAPPPWWSNGPAFRPPPGISPILAQLLASWQQGPPTAF